MTREAIKAELSKYRDLLAGMALRGLVFDNDREKIKGPFTAGAYALEIPGKVDAILERMTDGLERLLDPPKPLSVKAATPPVNGVTQGPLQQAAQPTRRP